MVSDKSDTIQCILVSGNISLNVYKNEHTHARTRTRTHTHTERERERERETLWYQMPLVKD